MVAVYARQSVDKGEQSLSIESQIEECKRRLSKANAFEVYQDRGFSGANTNRPGFTKMIADVKAGRIERVIVWKLDRISRSLLDFANIMAVFNQYSVCFDSVIDNFDTSTPMGRAMLNIVMVFAQLERETIQLRIMANYHKRAEKGFYLGGPATFGLQKVPIVVGGYKTSTLKLDPAHGQTLLKIFDMYANSDTSLGQLARYLNEQKLTTRTGAKWESQKLSRILHSPTYVQSSVDIYEYYKAKGVNILSPVEDFSGNGLYLYGRRKTHERKYTSVKDHNLAVALHEGVIDCHTWLKVQYKLEKNSQIENSGRGKHTWLAGLTKCGLCGYSLTGQTVKGRTFLRCSRRMNFKDCNGGAAIHADKVEQKVWGEIVKKAGELNGVKIERQAPADAKVNQLKIRLIKIEVSIGNLVEAIVDGSPVSAKIFSEKIDKLDEERSMAKAELQKITLQNCDIDTAAILKLFEENLSLDEKKIIAKSLIKRVTVISDDAPITIEWLF